jgi:hypothetical protein
MNLNDLRGPLRDEIDGLRGPATILPGLMDAGFAAVKPDQHLLYTTAGCISYFVLSGLDLDVLPAVTELKAL